MNESANTDKGHRATVLVVDDSKTILVAVGQILQQENYKVLTASNGEEGVEKAEAEHPDLILMDIEMPIMNGYQAVQTIRASEQLQETPIIMITTRNALEDVEKGYMSGCNDYVFKPVNTHEFLEKVRSWLETAE
ncbi:MAG: response regulator [Gemmatimonadota bacterium]|nr:response regulator [Gemmatimonadota bacterium]